MRSLVVALLAAGCFAGIVLVGGNALGVWDPLPQQAALAAKSPRPRASSVISSKRLKQTARPKKRASHTARDPLAPRQHLRAADMRIARRALLRPRDLTVGGWRAARPVLDDEDWCPDVHPDLSRFTVTGYASSRMTAGDSVMSSNVVLFTNAGQAALYFEATRARAVLGCLRESLKESFRRQGLQPRLLYARYATEPPVGARTATYVIDFLLRNASGARGDYPVDVITFQTGRAVGVLSFDFVVSDDGERPCRCELDEARLVESRLRDT